MSKYYGAFGSLEDVTQQFREDDYHYDENNKYVRNDLKPDFFPTEDEILFAIYGGGGYDGTAHVLYKRDGKLYEVNGSHCSCMGLEGQWGPEETTVAAIKLRPNYGLNSYDHSDDDRATYKALIDSLEEGK